MRTKFNKIMKQATVLTVSNPESVPDTVCVDMVASVPVFERIPEQNYECTEEQVMREEEINDVCPEVTGHAHFVQGPSCAQKLDRPATVVDSDASSCSDDNDDSDYDSDEPVRTDERVHILPSEYARIHYGLDNTHMRRNATMSLPRTTRTHEHIQKTSRAEPDHVWAMSRTL